jgi:hypothetical protein
MKSLLTFICHRFTFTLRKSKGCVRYRSNYGFSNFKQSSSERVVFANTQEDVGAKSNFMWISVSSLPSPSQYNRKSVFLGTEGVHIFVLMLAIDVL